MLAETIGGTGPVIRTLIADDETLARRGIRAKLQAHEDVHIVGECEDGLQTVERIREEQPDLLILDVQMPGLNGFDVVRALGEENAPFVVVVSAHEEHALEAFGIDAVDYLLKPLDETRFARALDRVRRRIQGDDSTHARITSCDGGRTPESNGAAEASRARLQWLLVKQGRRAFFVHVADVDWVGTSDNYLNVHLGRVSYLIRGRMNQLEQRLDPEYFVRIHRQTIVNRERIERVVFDESGQPWVVMRDETRLRVSRSYRAGLLDQSL